jgi:UDP-glucose 4-epimerase
VGHSVGEVIKGARKITGQCVPVVKGPRRLGDPAILLADPARARAELGLSLRFPMLEDMILSAWRWSRRNENTVPLDLDRLRQSSLVRL